MVAVTLNEEVESIECVRTDVLSDLWRFYTSNKEIVSEGRRFENLFWRIWAAERIEKTISGSRMGSIFRVIAEGEDAFQRSPYHIPPLRRPPTPPSTPVYTSPGSSLPSQFSVSVLQQALKAPAMDLASPPLPPQVPPPSPAPSIRSLKLDTNTPRAPPTLPRKSALKQERTTSDPLPERPKKTAFKPSPVVVTVPAVPSEEEAVLDSGRTNSSSGGGVEKRGASTGGGRTRARVQRPKFASRTASGLGRRSNSGRGTKAEEEVVKPVPVPAAAAQKVEAKDDDDWEADAEIEPKTEPVEVKAEAWIVEHGFHLQLKKAVNVEQVSESAAIAGKALPTIASVQDTAVVVKQEKGKTRYTEKTKAKYREGTEKLSGLAEEGSVLESPTVPTAKRTLPEVRRATKKSQLSLLFQGSRSKSKERKEATEQGKS